MLPVHSLICPFDTTSTHTVPNPTPRTSMLPVHSLICCSVSCHGVVVAVRDEHHISAPQCWQLSTCHCLLCQDFLAADGLLPAGTTPCRCSCQSPVRQYNIRCIWDTAANVKNTTQHLKGSATLKFRLVCARRGFHRSNTRNR